MNSRQQQWVLPYVTLLILLNGLMLGMPWGSAYLSLVIVVTYLVFRPKYVLHPCNMVFASYGLYVVLSSTLNLILDLIHWQYVLPWGQIVFWNEMSKYLLFQVEFTFLILFFGLRYFCHTKRLKFVPERGVFFVKEWYVRGLYIICVLLVFGYMQATAGISEWMSNYSYTYLTKREGYGLLNVIIIALGNLAVYLLGLQTVRSSRKLPIIVKAIILCAILSLIGGIKSRFIFLLIVYLSPFFLGMRFRLRTVFLFAISFFALLYVGTLFRTEFFYASASYFLEMLIGYFNAYQLHDMIVTSRAPDLFQTIWQLAVKPLQIIGLMSPDASFDISVMLTKEYFPDQWANQRATQQWPIETELYLNYLGVYFSWIPLLIYASLMGWLYRVAILGKNYWMLLIYVMEFQRLFSMLRGTLIPWEMPVYIVQYLFLYYVCKRAVVYSGRDRIPVKLSKKSLSHNGPTKLLLT